MQLAVDQSVLLPELALVASAAETSSALPSLSRLRLQATENGLLRLTASNLEYGLASELAAQVTEPGDISLAAKPLLSLMSKLSGEIAIATDERNYATITGESSRFRMPGEESDAFRELEPIPEGMLAVPGQIFAHLISRVAFAVGEITGYFQTPAALLRITGGVLILAASDGKRMALAEDAVASTVTLECLFPQRALLRAAKLVEGHDHACLAVGPRAIFLVAGSRLLVAQKVDGRFPDYSRLPPTLDVPPVIVETAALRTALARVLLFTETSARIDPKVRFALDPKGLVISAMSADAGEGEDRVPCIYTGEEVVVGFNPQLVRGFVEAAPAERLRLWIKDAKTASEWRLEGDDSYRYIVMPLPVKE